jgi:hypothetical protein
MGLKMLKKGIIALAGLVIFSAIIIASFAISNNNTGINPQSQVLMTSDNALSETPGSAVSIPTTYHTAVLNVKNKVKANNKILTLLEAQKIAEKYIEEPGATAGIPKLVKQDGKKVYVVPVIDHKQNVGEIILDSHNGKNLGGCGGVK